MLYLYLFNRALICSYCRLMQGVKILHWNLKLTECKKEVLFKLNRFVARGTLEERRNHLFVGQLHVFHHLKQRTVCSSNASLSFVALPSKRLGGSLLLRVKKEDHWKERVG